MTMAIPRFIALWLLGSTHLVTTLSVQKSNGLNRRDALSTATWTAGGLLLLPSSSSPAPAAASPATFVNLQDGTPFPLVSFGLQIYNDETAYQLTLTALEVGYRNFFASVLARNQKGFARAIRDSKIARNELFICGSVVSNRVSSFREAKQVTTQGWQENLKAFSVGNIDYLDQIMLDYPAPDAPSIRGQWSALEEMKNQKLVKTLAVSNFSPVQLDYILNDAEATAKPHVNQLPFSVAYHPGNPIQENTKRGILVQAWSPLGGSLGGRFNAIVKATCAEIGTKYGKSGAQVALRWIVQSGAAVCTQTKKKEHFIEDLDIFDFELSKQDMDTLGALA
jgi:diketogulonate reductase-like aldo/keto reductase